jgi:hypothetical protein
VARRVAAEAADLRREQEPEEANETQAEDDELLGELAWLAHLIADIIRQLSCLDQLPVECIALRG